MEDHFAVLCGDFEDLVLLRFDATQRERQKGADGRLRGDQIVESSVDNLRRVHFLGEELSHQKIGQFGSHSGLRDVAEDEGASDRDGSSREPLLSFPSHKDKLNLLKKHSKLFITLNIICNNYYYCCKNINK